MLFLSLSVSFNEEQITAISVTNSYPGAFRVWFHRKIFLFHWIGIAKAGNFQYDTQRFCHVVKKYCHGGTDYSLLFFPVNVTSKKNSIVVWSACAGHTWLAGITTLEQCFSTGFNKGNTYDMIQLFELSCAISDSAMPGSQQLLQMGTCPLSCLPSLFWIYFRHGSGHLGNWIDPIILWHVPPKHLFVNQWKPS